VASTKLPAAILGVLLLSGTGLLKAHDTLAAPTRASTLPQREAAAHSAVHPRDTAVTKIATMTTAIQNWRAVPPFNAVTFVSATTRFVAGTGAIYRTTSVGCHIKHQDTLGSAGSAISSGQRLLRKQDD
jgi:hypothetical protein